MLAFLGRLFTPRVVPPRRDPFDLLEKCEVCNAGLPSHQFVSLGSIVIEQGDPLVAQFIALMNERKWAELSQYSEWKGAEDNLMVIVMRCPTGREGFAMLVRDPFEMWEDIEVLQVVPLSSDEIDQIAALREKWDVITPITA